MAEKTIFAGLTVLEPGEDFAADDWGFTSRNPQTIDRYLEIGAVTHRHDARPALEDPTASALASGFASGGALSAGEDFYIAYTLLDERGGETLPSQAVVVTMDPPLDSSDASPSAEAQYGSGFLPVGVYYYVVSILDDTGGETPPGPWVQVERVPGDANGQVLLSGLDEILAQASGAAWAVYRSTSGGQFHYIAQGSGATLVDDGTLCANCSRRPKAETENTTNSDGHMVVTIPSAAMVDSNGRVAEGFNLYISRGGGFASPSLYETYPSASAGVAIPVTTYAPQSGRPPDVSTAVRGASKIDPDTELLDWHWKTPVTSSGDLPSGAASADVRAVVGEGVIYGYFDGVWQPLGGQLTVVVGSAEYAASELELVGSGGLTIEAVDAGGGRTIVTLTEGGSGGGVGTDERIGSVAASGSGEVAPASAIMFVASGAAEVSVASAGGGSAVVTIFAPSGGAAGPEGPAGEPGTPGAPGENVVDVYASGDGSAPGASAIVFVGSGGTVVGVSQDGASAIVTVTSSGTSGGGSGLTSVAASGGGSVSDATGLLFVGGENATVSVASGAGGSAVVTISAQPAYEGLTGSALTGLTDFETLTLGSGWSHANPGASGSAAVALDKLTGLVYLRAPLSRTASASAIIATVPSAPVDYRPTTAHRWVNENGVGIEVLTNGEIHALGDLSGLTEMSVSMLCWEGSPVASAGLVTLDYPGRRTASAAIAGVAAGASASGFISLAPGYRLYKIETSPEARVRLYATEGALVTDAPRASGDDPTGDHGVMLDFVTASGDMDWTLSPLVDGFSGDSPPSSEIPMIVENLASASADVEVEFTYLRTE